MMFNITIGIVLSIDPELDELDNNDVKGSLQKIINEMTNSDQFIIEDFQQIKGKKKEDNNK